MNFSKSFSDKTLVINGFVGNVGSAKMRFFMLNLTDIEEVGCDVFSIIVEKGNIGSLDNDVFEKKKNWLLLEERVCS